MKEEDILNSLQANIRNELFSAFNEILRNFREQRWEPSELNGGKLCEIIYTIIRGFIDGNIPNTSSKPRNFVDASRNLEQASGSVPRSFRIQIPRILIALYEIRNNRGVGHAGGDINPNHMDAVAVLYMSKWLMAELVRVFHNVTTYEAQTLVEKIIERVVPIIWEIDGKMRILNKNLTKKEATLIILYHSQTKTKENKLVESIEHSNASIYRRDILKKLHKERFIEYNSLDKTAIISPKGNEFVEKKLL